jgi:hypothetical protein
MVKKYRDTLAKLFKKNEVYTCSEIAEALDILDSNVPLKERKIQIPSTESEAWRQKREGI